MYFRYPRNLGTHVRMTTLRLLATIFALTACVTEEPTDVDDAITEDEAGKADEVQAYKHYLIVAGWQGDELTGRYLLRAGGGKLRCPDDVVRERCEITDYDLVPTLGLDESPTVILDEIEDHPMIARGRLVRTDDDRVYLRMSALTRGLTTVQPSSPTTCFRLTPAAHTHTITKLDTSTVVKVQTLYWDYVDPTPDFWGQPTPAVQAKIDAALAVSGTRPVYTCGSIDKRETGDLYWAEQVFAPN
jgi:hypothetical protein